MKRILISFLFAWFLIIQSISYDGRAIGVIPVQDESYCNKVIEKIKYRGFSGVDYYCVDVGNV